MLTIKGVLNFCKAAIFYDCKSLGIIDEINQVRKCVINNFHETIPVSRILLSLSIIDDWSLKIMIMWLKRLLKIFMN